ncbi:MAG: pentapeptide repeat-containing protein, partial [Deltaproteobacteria bacterium]|nr:pentapeptide repeat-containing protein [Deltaproteobacteria bacterium]
MTFTMRQTIEQTGQSARQRNWFVSLLVACSVLVAPAAALADPFLDEIDLGILDHRGHDHSGEDASFGIVSDVDATCAVGPVCTDFSSTDFFHVELIDSDFSGAIFDGADFSFADFDTSIFALATFYGAILDDAYIEFSDFSGADFNDELNPTDPAASFRRATIRAGHFDAADLRGTDFTDTQFRCITDPDQTSETGFLTLCPTFIETDFREANLTSSLFAPAFAGDTLTFSATDFRGANLTDAFLAGITDPCLQTDPVLNLWDCMLWGADPALDPNTIVEGLTLLDASDLRGSDMRNLDFERGEFPGVLIAGTQFTGSTFRDTEFDESVSTCEVIDLDDHNRKDDDYDEVVAARAAEIALCAFLSDAGALVADFRDTQFFDVSFSGAELGNASFVDGDDGDATGASLSDTDFSDAILDGTDFTDAVFDRVVLDRVALGCTNNPEVFDDDCGECADFSGVFGGQPPPTPDGQYSIQMRSIDFDAILSCSALRVAAAGLPLIDDFSNVDLNGGSFRRVDVTAVSFTGANLVDVNFNESTITGVNFDGADMSLADLSEAVAPCAVGGGGCASFVGTTLTLADLSKTAFPMADFDDAVFDSAIATNTDFSNASFGDQDDDGTGSSFVGAILSASDFSGASFSAADLTGAGAVCLTKSGDTVCASFAGATFTDSDLSDVNFKGADLRGARFIDSDLSGANFSDADLDGTTSLAGSQIDGLDLQGVDMTQAASDLFQLKVNFDPDPDLDEDFSDARGVQLDSTDLSGIDFSNLELRNWSFNGAVIENANFAMAELDGAQMASVQLDAYLVGAQISKLAGVNLTNADLQNLDLSGFDLSGANLTNARVTNTLFSGADLRNTTLFSLNQICNTGIDCAELTDARLGCADLAFTNISDFAVRDGLDALVTDETMLFQFVDPDLSGIKLVSMGLSGYDFSNLDLSRSDLGGSLVSGADFTGATLNGASLKSAGVCATSITTTCALFGNTDLVGSSDCNLQQAVDFSNVSFVNAPTDLFEGTIVDDSVACVNFTGANLSYIDDLGTSGFDFNDLTDWNGAVLAGAQLRFQDFSTTNSGDFFEDFFRQLGHAAASRDDLCSEDDNNVDPIDPSPDLRDTVFSCADIRGQDLSNSDLRGAEFVRTAIGDPGFDLTGAALQGADFSNVDFSENSLAAIFQGVSTVKEDDGDENTIDPPITDDSGVEYPDLRDVRLIHANLASLAGAFDLHHVDLSGAILDGADLTGADLTDAILDDLVSLCGEYDTAGDDPQLCPRDPQPDPACVILDNATLTGASFRNVDFSELIDNETIAVIARDFFQQVAGGNLNGTNFSGANLAGMNLDGLDFTDALSIGLSRPCDGVGECASFEGTLMGSNDPLKPMSLSGYDFQEASIAGARFTNVSLSFADLSDVGDLCTPESVCLSITGANSNLQSAILRDLDLTLVDFGTVDSGTEADDRLINFRGALFNRANLSGLDLSDRDFTGANFAAANLSGTNLDGAILASSFNGCERIDGVDVCTNFDTATMCGIDARSATLSASFAGVDAYPPGCSEPAN